MWLFSDTLVLPRCPALPEMDMSTTNAGPFSAVISAAPDVVTIPMPEFRVLTISADAILVVAGRTWDQESERLLRRTERYRDRSLA